MSFSLLSACPRRLSRTLSSAPHSSPHHHHYYYHHHHRFSLLSPPCTSQPLSPLSTGSSREFSSSSSVSTAHSWPFLRSPRPPLTNWHQNLLSLSAAKTTASARLLSSALVLSSTVPADRPRFIYTMTGGDPSSTKRKHSSVTDSNAPSVADQPAKHLKPETVNILTPGDSTPANGTVYDVQNEDDASRLLAIGSTQADSPEWQATIENVVKSVVSIHYCQTCSFDTELSMSSQATGFVVDAQRGYILTNRHVVCSGPFWGYVIFDNHEEVGKPSMDLV